MKIQAIKKKRNLPLEGMKWDQTKWNRSNIITANGSQSKSIRVRFAILSIVGMLLLFGCQDKEKQREEKRQEDLITLSNKICQQEETQLEIGENNIIITCENETTYVMTHQEGRFDTHYSTKLPSATLNYTKYGERIQAVVTGQWIVDSVNTTPLEVRLHLIAGSNQDQEFDVIIDLETQTIYRMDEKTTQRGSKLVFIDSLQEELLSHASSAIIGQSKPLLDQYGNLYQMQNRFLNEDALTLRENAYELPFSIQQILMMQFPIQVEGNHYQETGEQANAIWDMANQQYIINDCDIANCGYQQAIYDIQRNIVVYDPQTTKEIEVDPDTCTNEKFCEVSKTMKTKMISTLAFHSKLFPFRQSVEYNAQFTRGNKEALNRYLEGLRDAWKPAD